MINENKKEFSMKKLFPFCIVGFFLLVNINIGFAKKYYNTPFLDKVERKPVTETDTNIIIDKKGIYKDRLISIAWSPEPLGFYFELTNESESTVSILWEECYLGNSFTKYTIVHSGIKDIRVMPPTSIASQKKLNDFIYPAAFARYVRGRYTEIRFKKIYNEKVKKKVIATNSFTPQSFIATLSLKSGDNYYTYVFHFKTELVER
jgi:hypothetical protein